MLYNPTLGVVTAIDSNSQHSDGASFSRENVLSVDLMLRGTQTELILAALMESLRETMRNRCGREILPLSILHVATDKIEDFTTWKYTMNDIRVHATMFVITSATKSEDNFAFVSHPDGTRKRVLITPCLCVILLAECTIEIPLLSNATIDIYRLVYKEGATLTRNWFRGYVGSFTRETYRHSGTSIISSTIVAKNSRALTTHYPVIGVLLPEDDTAAMAELMSQFNTYLPVYRPLMRGRRTPVFVDTKNYDVVVRTTDIHIPKPHSIFPSDDLALTDTPEAILFENTYLASMILFGVASAKSFALASACFRMGLHTRPLHEPHLLHLLLDYASINLKADLVEAPTQHKKRKRNVSD